MTGLNSLVLRLACAAVVIGSLGACAKGGTTLDEDAVDTDSPSGAGAGGGGGSELCGNGRIDSSADEECDGSRLSEATCTTLGFMGGGKLSCDPDTCRFDTSMCVLRSGNGSSAGSSG